MEPDNEDHLPIPLAVAGTPAGKTRARSSIKDWSDDNSDDVLLEVHNPQPIAFAYPLPSTSVDTDGQVTDVPPVAEGGHAPILARKLGGPGTSDNGATPPPPKRKKTSKRAGGKAPLQKPTSVG